MSETQGRVTKLTSSQESVDGKNLLLDIIHHDTSNLCFEFTVKNVSKCFTVKELFFSGIVILAVLAVLDIYHPNFYAVIFLICIIVRFFVKLLWTVKSESVLLIAPVGLQLTATYQSGHQTSRFIPWYFITDVIINEAINLHRVVYYLAVLVEQPYCATTTKKLIPLFQVIILRGGP
ncbi:hypothetical protein ANN_16642 [Periplaneta americana]|uniref:Phosphatidylinositol N-acetylglucosaminyltransferase subunit H conserved domain-containing protein n=1 Tax=Periplaneta americana TaxID=6978 RepID=A0ABQ8SRR4_PERAM|nr:hypothetical protein ANN_16642 [Periplaneta americana]